MRFKIFVRRSQKNAKRSAAGMMNLCYRTHKYRFPPIITRLLQKRAWQRFNYPRLKCQPIPKKFLLMDRRHD
jgi:hypothetical protein